MTTAHPSVDIATAPIDELASRFTVWDESVAADPYPLLHRLRLEKGIVRSELFGGYWALFRYADVRQVLSQPEIFSSTIPTVPPPPANQINNIPVGLDPPEHTAYRHILQPMFSPARMKALEDQLRQSARDLIARFPGPEADFDFLMDFAVPLPCHALLNLLGLPVADLGTLLEFKDGMIREQFNPDPAERERFRVERLPQMTEYFLRHIEARRDQASAPDDLLTDIVHASFREERPLTTEEIVSIVTLLISAGLDTTTAELCHFMAYFAKNPDRWEQLQQRPDLIPGAVEELLRHNSIVTLARLCTQDTVVGDVAIAKGDMVAPILLSASLDELAFPDALAVDFERKPNSHLAFGGGPHRCLGSNLARVELRVALEELLAALPRFHASSGPDRLFGVIAVVAGLRLQADPA